VSAARRPARAEVVGSLLRPGRLLEAHDAIEGIESSSVPVRFRNAAGERVVYDGVPRITGPLRKVDSPLAREADRLRAITDHPFKVTLPAASWFLPAAFFEQDGFYDSHDELLEATLAIQRELIAEAIGARAGYVQLDFPSYVQLVDDGAREYAIVRQGIDPDAFLAKALELDRRVIEGFPVDVTFGLHICRGNFRSMWIYEGALDPVAEAIFNELPYDVFLLEWDDPDRTGDYAALRHLPKGPVAVLGLVSTKHPQLEDRDALVREIGRAAEHADLGQLALSPQCGFASVAEGNRISPDAQWAKLEVVGRTAAEVWG
jgi:5-methyltetrahydropteroyltriglutamate--homocysteine methyltransferase